MKRVEGSALAMIYSNQELKRMINKIMDTKNESYYFIMIINMIAKKHNLSIYDTYQYLNQYKGIRFLHDFYDVEHTLNTDDVIDDVLAICNKNGGSLK